MLRLTQKVDDTLPPLFTNCILGFRFPLETHMQRLSKCSTVLAVLWVLSLAVAQPAKSPSPAPGTKAKPALDRAIQVLFSGKSYTQAAISPHASPLPSP